MANTRNVRFITKQTAVPGRIPTGTTGYEDNLIRQGEIAQNTADKKLFGFDGSNVFEFGSNSFLNLSGGTVSGTTNFSTLSAVTYLGLPSNTFTGGTVSGNTIFTAGLTANTLNINNYIDFATGTTIPNNVSGRLFYNKVEQALAYYPNSSQDVIVNLGQQQYIRVNNASGTIISKGAVVCAISATGGTTSVTLAVSTGQTGNNIIGLAAHNIGVAEQGLVITQGLLSGLTINSFTVGQNIYCSDVIPGAYIGNPSVLTTASRINLLGWITATGTTAGQIFVKIVNENSEELLTIKEKNLILGNSVSTGAYNFTGITTASTTTINIAPMEGWIVYNTGAYAYAPDVYNILYTGQTGVSLSNLTSSDVTYLLITSARTVTQQTTYPSPTQRRNNIFIGGILHPNRSTIYEIINKVDYDVSPISQLRDMFEPIRIINQSITAYANGANLNFNTTAGDLHSLGINWVNDQLNPNVASISAKTAASFYYGTRTGITSTVSTTSINPNNYDVAGVITAIPTGGDGNSQRSTNQRIYVLPDGDIVILYGQQTYESLALALAGQQTETFVRPNVISSGAILIGLLAVRRNQTVLNNSTIAVFTPASMFGESVGGVNGISTTTLQQAYNNSTAPEIIINSTLDGLTIQNGTGNADNVTNLLEGQNAAGTTTSLIRADGYISASTLNAGILQSGGTNLYSIFATSAGSGENNTASNLDGGFGLFAQKVGVDLQFKSLTSTGGTLNITSGASTVNIEFGLTGALREKNVLTTTDGAQTLLGQITGLTSGSYIVESYITANKSNTEYGIWKRTLGIVTTGGTPIIVYESADLDKVTTGFSGCSITYSGVSGNIVDIFVNGIAASTYNWFSYYEVVDQGIAGLVSEDYVIKSSSYNITIGNRTIEVIVASTQTLPSAVGLLSKEYRIINASSGSVIVNTTSSQTIGNKVVGNPTSITLNPEEWLDVQGNGSNWRIV